MNNRSLTLTGANKIFSPIGIEIEQHSMGYYQATYRGTLHQAKTLTELCQALIVSIANANA
jgi:hypothetical protein